MKKIDSRLLDETIDKYKIELAERLASDGDKRAMMMVCQYFFDERAAGRIPVNTLPVREYLEELAEDSSRARLLLGIMYYTGVGVQQNYEKAFKWYKAAAEAGEPYGLCNLGYCYYYGRGTEVDDVKAYDCFAQAALLDNPNAMYKLGDMYFYGNHAEENKDAAVYWYREAFGHLDGDSEVEANIKYRLGKCYLHGFGTAENLALALRLLQEAEFGLVKLVGQAGSFAKEQLPLVWEELDEARRIIQLEMPG